MSELDEPSGHTVTLTKWLAYDYGAFLGAQGRGVGRPAGSRQALHFSWFTIMQASLRTEGHGVPTKGLARPGDSLTRLRR
jgi:hypothetical protein